MLAHGLTGTGKTTRALKGGKPLVICTEPKAEAHILKLNPQATCWVPESCDDLTKIFEWLGDPKLQEGGYTRIVLDSYTELTELLPNWILRKQAQDATVEIGRRIDIGEYRPIGEWGVALIRAIQLSGFPSIIIARSDAKKMGLIEQIVPAGLGSSARNLNAQLVPTVESRFDGEMQAFIWDSRPNEYSQRCGLEWVPPVFQGTADEFLALVENGEALAPPPGPGTTTEAPAAPAPAAVPPVNVLQTPAAAAAVMDKAKAQAAAEPPAAVPPPAAPAVNPPASLTAFQNALVEFNQASFKAGWSADERKRFHDDFMAMGPEALPRLLEVTKGLAPAPTTVGAVLAQLPPTAKPEISATAENFVDEVDRDVVFISATGLAALQDILTVNKVDQPSFLRYCEAEKHIMPAANKEIRLDRMVQKAFEKLLPILQSERRRGSLVAFIVNKFPASTAA
jgi:hypothetical protein